MAQTISVKPAGQTFALSVQTAITAVAVTYTVNDDVNFAEFFNSGATVVAVQVGQLTVTGSAQASTSLVFPVVTTPSVATCFMLPASMTQPVVKPVSIGQVGGGFTVSAIGSTNGPSIIYITPCLGM